MEQNALKSVQNNTSCFITSFGVTRERKQRACVCVCIRCVAVFTGPQNLYVQTSYAPCALCALFLSWGCLFGMDWTWSELLCVFVWLNIFQTDKQIFLFKWTSHKDTVSLSSSAPALCLPVSLFVCDKNTVILEISTTKTTRGYNWMFLRWRRTT